jgi:hypothetical protein
MAARPDQILKITSTDRVSFSYLIVIELAFLLIAVTALGWWALRVLRGSRDQAYATIASQKTKMRALREDLTQARATIASLQAALAASAETQAADASSAEDMGALIVDLDESMSIDSQGLIDLNGLQYDLAEGFDRFDKLQAPNDTSAWDIAEMRRELALLREQSGRSGRVINDLTRSLEHSRGKVREIEKNYRQRYSRTFDSKYDESEKTIRRLTTDNRTLQARLERELSSHQDAIERITAMLRDSDEKYRQLVRTSKEEKFSMSAAIDHLRQQLSASVDKKMNEEQTRELLARLAEMDAALARSQREREFLDARFVELEEALEQAEVVYEELNRTKVEYRMLEERFLRMDTDDEVAAVSAQSAATATTETAAPAWQPVPETPETVEFDNTVLGSLAPETKAAS